MSAPSSTPDVVTVVTSRRIKRGREAEFERLLEGIDVDARKMPGYVERKVIRPRDHEHPEYVIIFKFDSYAHLRAWTTSPIRKAWLKKISKVASDPFKEQILTGLESWFTSPVQPGVAPPPAWKMALVTGAVVYPLAMALNIALNARLGFLPMPLRSLLSCAIMISLMTWVIMPRVTRALHGWLYPQVEPAAQSSASAAPTT